MLDYHSYRGEHYEAFATLEDWANAWGWYISEHGFPSSGPKTAYQQHLIDERARLQLQNQRSRSINYSELDLY